MAPENVRDHGGAKKNSAFIDTSLDTHMATFVTDSDTVSDFKRKISLEHGQCFPAIGDIKIHSLKMKRRGTYYTLVDSMLVKDVFKTSEEIWFLSADASRVEQQEDIQDLDTNKAGDQLALPWVTDSLSIDSQAERPSKLSSLVHGSTSMNPKTVPFVKQKVPRFGDSCKDVSKNFVEDSEQQLDSTKTEEKLDAVNKEIKSKKRLRGDARNEGLEEDALESKKKRKTKRKVEIVKSKDDNSIEHKPKGIDATVDDEHKRDISVSEKEINRVKESENKSAHDQVATVEEETLAQKNTDSSEVMRDVAMIVEKYFEEEMPIQMTQNEKGNELVQEAIVGNEIVSSSMRASDCERDAPVITSTVSHQKSVKRSTKHKIAEKEVSSTPSIKKTLNASEATGDRIDERKEDDTEVKVSDKIKETKRRKVKKSSAKNKDESQVKHVDNLVEGIVYTPVFDEKIVDEEKNEKGNEVSEETLVDDKKDDDTIVKIVESSEPIESHKSKVNVENVEEESKKESKDTARTKKKKKDVKHTNDEDQDNVEIKILDALHEDHGKTDDIKDDSKIENETKKTKKKKMVVDKVKVKEAKKNDTSSVNNNDNNQSTNELNLESEKSKIIEHQNEETLKNGNVSEVCNGDVNNEAEVDTPKEASQEIDFRNYFGSSQQPNKIDSVDKVVDEVKDAKLKDKEKKLKKKTKELQISSTDVVKDQNIPNSNDQFKTPKRVIRKNNAPKNSIGQNGPSTESSSRSESLSRSSFYQKSYKQQSTLKKNSSNVKSLLNARGTIFGDDNNESSADDNARVKSDSSTRTPSSSSSSSGESASSIDSRKHGSRVVKRKEGGGKNIGNSQLKNVSMGDLLRSSSRFKKARLNASQVDDTESEPVHFVPESQPLG